MITAGIDSGSTATKVVLADNGRIVAAQKMITGTDPRKTATLCFQAALSQAGLSSKDIGGVVATGYGRERVLEADKCLTEITCHAKGAHSVVPRARTVIDIGGQDSKVIRLDEQGFVVDFIMNDKCAAGTGRFLEVMANRLEISLEEFGQMWRKTRQAAKISSTCTVFAESEVISLVSAGADLSAIVKGLCNAVAGRVASMARRVGVEPQVVFTGGVSLNEGVRQSLCKVLSVRAIVPPRSQFMGAYGAALFARHFLA